MNFAISWVLGLFKKPEVEITFNQKPTVKKPTTRKPAVKKVVAKKVVAKKATKVVKKAK
jgi:hypothetical protein